LGRKINPTNCVQCTEYTSYPPLTDNSALKDVTEKHSVPSVDSNLDPKLTLPLTIVPCPLPSLLLISLLLMGDLDLDPLSGYAVGKCRL